MAIDDITTHSVYLVNHARCIHHFFKYLFYTSPYFVIVFKEWTLCLGAGICKGILPDWFDLTNRLVNRCFGYTWDSREFKKQSDQIGFSMDSWIQGCLNQHIIAAKGTILSFNEILEEELYSNLLDKATTYNLRTPVIKLFEKPKTLKPSEVLLVCEFFENEYGDTTLMQLVTLLLKPSSSINLPNSIVTFNADSLLYSLLMLFSIRNHNRGKVLFNYPKESFRKITQPFQTWSTNIPIFHLHGSISPTLKVKTRIDDSRDHLIFLESSYTKVAGSMFSWAQSNFLFFAQNNKLVFLGLSMSDPNIRRWLSWTAENYQKELQKKLGNDTLSLRHLWIKTKMKSPESQNFIDVSLHHLGVKVGLIDNWSQIGRGMENLMAK
jgi:hypothetical protein